jgi:hypothetical protein
MPATLWEIKVGPMRRPIVRGCPAPPSSSLPFTSLLLFYLDATRDAPATRPFRGSTSHQT